MIRKACQKLDFIVSKNMRSGMEHKQGGWWSKLRVEGHCKNGAIAFSAGTVFSDCVGRISLRISNLDLFFGM
jgi:hypothetical protein